MNRQHAGNGFNTWRIGKVEVFDHFTCAEVIDDRGLVARIFGRDEADARRNAAIVAISPEMYRALAGAATCLERFMLPPEQIAASHEAAK